MRVNGFTNRKFPMLHIRTLVLTLLAMIAFAGNSLLCRIALKHTSIDAASFTTIRLTAGAIMLWLIVRMRHGAATSKGNWLSALALFVYAAGFSFAYVSLPASTGALLLFGAVQATMIGHGIWQGERLQRPQLFGLLLAFAGLVGLLLPGLTAPPVFGSVLMLIAGIAWGIYSLRGKGAGDPIQVTAGNFLRTLPITAVLMVIFWNKIAVNNPGFIGRTDFGHWLRHLVHRTSSLKSHHCRHSPIECSSHCRFGWHRFSWRIADLALHLGFAGDSWWGGAGDLGKTTISRY
jgi:drug/metabolite transporter (DMT)-like permease